MIKSAISALVLCLFWIPVFGQPKVEQMVFEKANQAYLDGNYSIAAEEYQKILHSGRESAELYYNLGNAYYKLGQYPHSILYYERALKLNPKDEDIRFNLDLANRFVVDKINPQNEFFLKKWLKSIASVLSAEVWGILSLLAFAIVLGMIIFVYSTRGSSYRKSAIPIGVVLFLLLGIFLLLGTIQYRYTSRPDTAIVFASSITAKSSPDSSGTDLFVIHEGLKVRILEEVSGWIRIRLSDGNEAWIPETSVERI